MITINHIIPITIYSYYDSLLKLKKYCKDIKYTYTKNEQKNDIKVMYSKLDNETKDPHTIENESKNNQRFFDYQIDFILRKKSIEQLRNLIKYF